MSYMNDNPLATTDMPQVYFAPDMSDATPISVDAMGIDGLQDRLKDARLRLGLTQHEVGERAGIRAPTITRYEKGANLPSATALVGLASALDVSVEWLLLGEQGAGSPPGSDVQQAIPPGWQEYADSAEGRQLTDEELGALADMGRAAWRVGRMPTPYSYAAWAGILRTLTTAATTS